MVLTKKKRSGRYEESHLLYKVIYYMMNALISAIFLSVRFNAWLNPSYIIDEGARSKDAWIAMFTIVLVIWLFTSIFKAHSEMKKDK